MLHTSVLVFFFIQMIDRAKCIQKDQKKKKRDYLHKKKERAVIRSSEETQRQELSGKQKFPLRTL
jgi:hypothetical protein